MQPAAPRPGGGRVGQDTGRAVANRTLGPTARSRFEKRSTRMKKLLFLGLLSVAAIGIAPRDAHAWFLDWCRSCCCDRCTTKLCIKPYNAFSPVAYGSIVADGCMPINIYGGCRPPLPMPSCFGCPSYGPGCCTSGCCDVGCLPAPGSYANAPQMSAPAMQSPPVPLPNPGPQFQPPAPQLLHQSAYMVPMPMQPAYGYNPMPMPTGYGYNPMYPYAMPPMNGYAPPQVPAYWYGR
jgi:hypothetical protein